MPISVTYGKTYKNLPASGRIYETGDGRSVYPGGTFVASMSSVGDEGIQMGFGRGHMVEIFDDATLALRAARRDQLIHEIAIFCETHFGASATQRQLAQDTLNTQFNADNAGAITIDTVRDSDEAVTGTVTISGKYRALINGVADGAVFTVAVAGAFSHSFTGEPVAGDIIGVQAMLADGTTPASDVVNTITLSSDVTLSAATAGDTVVTFAIARDGTYQAQINGVDSGAPAAKTAGVGRTLTLGATLVGGDIVGVYETSAPITDPVTTTATFKAPAITEPVNDADTTVTVTSSPAAANGTAVNVYRLGVSIGAGVVAGGAGTCVVTVSNIVAGDSLTAKHGAGASLSAASVAAIVHYDAPVITSNNVQGSDQCNGTSTAADGTVVNAYINGVFAASDAVTGGAFIINGVIPQVGGDSLTAKVGVDPSASLSAASAPKIVQFNAPVIDDTGYTAMSTSVTGTSDAADGTAIQLFRGGIIPIGAPTTVTGGVWTRNGLTLVGNYSLTAVAGSGSATSDPSAAVVVHFDAPVVSAIAPAAHGTGTSDAADGTLITLFKQSLGVGSFDAITPTGTVSSGAFDINPDVAFVATDVVKAKAGTGANLSAFSNAITVT